MTGLEVKFIQKKRCIKHAPFMNDTPTIYAYTHMHLADTSLTIFVAILKDSHTCAHSADTYYAYIVYVCM